MKFDDFMGLAGSDTSKAILAGALGGLVRWITLRPNWKEGSGAILVGAICALYLGPLIEPILEPIIGKISPDGDADGFASFMVGMGGISLTGFIIDIFNKRAQQGSDKDD